MATPTSCIVQMPTSTSRLSDKSFDRIRHAGARMARNFRLRSDDRLDLTQHLTAEVLQALHKHDPTRGCQDALAYGALSLASRHWMREVSRRAARGPSARPRWFAEGEEPEDRSPEPHAEVDLRLDLERVLSALPRELRITAEALKTLNVTEAAADLGVDRGTIYRRIKLLREYLGPFAELADGPRNTSAETADLEECGRTLTPQNPPGGAPPAVIVPSRSRKAS